VIVSVQVPLLNIWAAVGMQDDQPNSRILVIVGPSGPII
jgi:hypothetical protein